MHREESPQNPSDFLKSFQQEIRDLILSKQDKKEQWEEGQPEGRFYPEIAAIGLENVGLLNETDRQFWERIKKKDPTMTIEDLNVYRAIMAKEIRMIHDTEVQKRTAETREMFKALMVELLTEIFHPELRTQK